MYRLSIRNCEHHPIRPVGVMYRLSWMVGYSFPIHPQEFFPMYTYHTPSLIRRGSVVEHALGSVSGATDEPAVGSKKLAIETGNSGVSSASPE